MISRILWTFKTFWSKNEDYTQPYPKITQATNADDTIDCFNADWSPLYLEFGDHLPPSSALDGGGARASILNDSNPSGYLEGRGVSGQPPREMRPRALLPPLLPRLLSLSSRPGLPRLSRASSRHRGRSRPARRSIPTACSRRSPGSPRASDPLPRCHRP